MGSCSQHPERPSGCESRHKDEDLKAWVQDERHLFLFMGGGSGHGSQMVSYNKEFGQGYAAFLENFPRVFSEIPKAHLPRMTPPCRLQGFGGAHHISEMEKTQYLSLHSRMPWKRPGAPKSEQPPCGTQGGPKGMWHHC